MQKKQTTIDLARELRDIYNALADDCSCNDMPPLEVLESREAELLLDYRRNMQRPIGE